MNAPRDIGARLVYSTFPVKNWSGREEDHNKSGSSCVLLFCFAMAGETLAHFAETIQWPERESGCVGKRRGSRENASSIIGESRGHTRAIRVTQSVDGRLPGS
jgi:hypothetical protein